MSKNGRKQKYHEVVEEAPKRIERASNDATTILRGSSWNTMRGLQHYNEKLLEIAQANINAAFDFFRQMAVAKSPSEFITAATEQARRQVETSNEQAQELAGLAQRLALRSTEPVKEYAAKTFDKAA